MQGMKLILEYVKLRPKIKGEYEEFVEGETHNWIKLLIQLISEDNNNPENFFQQMLEESQNNGTLSEIIKTEVKSTHSSDLFTLDPII